MNRVLLPAAIAVGSFVSVIVLLTRLRGANTLFDSGASWRVLIQGNTACLALAAVVAVIATFILRERTITVAAGALGLLMLGSVAAIGTSATWSSYCNAVAAGLAIAAMSSLTTSVRDREGLQGWLIAGALGGALLAVPLERYQSRVDYTGAYTVVSTPPDWPLVIGAAVGLVLLAAAWFTISPNRPARSTPGTSGRTLALGIVIPVAALLLWWWFLADEVFGNVDATGTATWPYGILLVPLVLGGALCLPGRDGLALAAMLATLAALATLPRWEGSWPMLLAFVALVVGGMLTGRRQAHPKIAVAVLGVCTLATAFDQSPWDIFGIVAAFIAPAAGAHAVAACLPTTAAVGAISVSAPATLFSVTGITVGWVAYDIGSPSGFSNYHPNTTALVLSTATVVACAATIAYLTLRRQPTDNQ
jgi:hypothetical protein